MNRENLVLAALAAGGENAFFSPVQVQKLFFLIDREIPELVNGPHFDFRPYDYGPFDSSVYGTVSWLARNGLAVIEDAGRYRRYALSQAGFHRGTQELQQIGAPAATFITQAAQWVRHLSFQQLVAAIYKRYPDMQVNSVFQG